MLPLVNATKGLQTVAWIAAGSQKCGVRQQVRAVSTKEEDAISCGTISFKCF